MNKFLAGVIQLDSQDDVQANLAAAEELIRGATAQGAKLICMPESVNYVGPESGTLQKPSPVDRPSSTSPRWPKN